MTPLNTANHSLKVYHNYPDLQICTILSFPLYRNWVWR